MIGWQAGFGSYHVGGFEGVPLAADATRDTETKTRVLLYSHTQLEREDEEKKKKERQKKTKKEKKETQVKVKYRDHNKSPHKQRADNMHNSGRVLSCDV